MRLMIYKAKIPYQIQYYTVEYIVYLKNRLLTIALPFGLKESDIGSAEIPFKVYKHVKLNVLKLKVFRYAIQPLRTRGGFLPKSELRIYDNYIFVRMTRNYIYRLLDCKTFNEVVHTDVGFNEYQYPKIVILEESKIIKSITVRQLH